MMNKDKVNFERKPKSYVREARPDDIQRLVEIDLECFRDVYEDNPVDSDDIYAMLTTRQKIAQKLMAVGEIDGIIEGFMTCQRTDKESSQVKNWEETTNFGTMVDTHAPLGKNFYIVNLTVTAKGSEQGLSDQLIASLLGRFVEVQGEVTQLLSRMPQFSEWLNQQGIEFESLLAEEQDELAQVYTSTTKVIDGQERLYDGMLQRYSEFGAKPVSVLRNGFTDPASCNYSVLCEFKNPLPDVLKRSHLASLLAGRAIRYAANHPKLLAKLP